MACAVVFWVLAAFSAQFSGPELVYICSVTVIESKMALLVEHSKCTALIKALLSFGIFIGICAGIVHLLVQSSNAKAAKGGNGFGMSWSGSDRGKW
jgi:hypothetical protein